MADLNTLETLFDAAAYKQRCVRDARDKRRRELEEAARKQIAEQIDAEFGQEWREIQDTTNQRQTELEDARIAAGKERLAEMNYGRGTLIEWSTHKENWYNLQQRYWYYRTGRKGFLAVWDRDAEYPDNMRHSYTLPQLGDLYIRLLKKDGKPGRQFYKWHGDAVPNWWLPEDENHEKAAPNEK
jgi:hypothetical protein